MWGVEQFFDEIATRETRIECRTVLSGESEAPRSLTSTSLSHRILMIVAWPCLEMEARASTLLGTYHRLGLPIARPVPRV
jgi:subtilisin-like proprotein convertase family protein